MKTEARYSISRPALLAAASLLTLTAVALARSDPLPNPPEKRAARVWEPLTGYALQALP